MVVAAALLAAVLGAAGCRGGGLGVEERVEDLPVADGSCPPRRSSAPSRGVGAVPAGAVAVRLCGGRYDPVQEVPEPLTTDLDSLADLVNEQAVGDTSSCPDVGGPDYVLVFSYPGGHVQRADGGLGGCGTIVVGGVAREGAARVLDEVVARFAEQRATTEPPADLDPPSLRCPRYTYPEFPRSLVATGAEMTRAVLCVALGPNAPTIVARVPLPPRDLQVLLDDLAAGVRSSEPCRGSDPSAAARRLDRVGRRGDRADVLRRLPGRHRLRQLRRPRCGGSGDRRAGDSCGGSCWRLVVHNPCG